MKKMLITGVICALALSVLIPTVSAQACVHCKNNHDRECQRVIVGNEVYIYYGDREPCGPIE